MFDHEMISIKFINDIETLQDTHLVYSLLDIFEVLGTLGIRNIHSG